MDNFSVEKLEELGIFEIRNIAREVGVYSPTTLKKQELIDSIINIMNGKLEPYVRKTKQGRPPKSISSLNSLMDVIVPDKVFENKKEEEKEKLYFHDFNETINVNEVSSNEQYFHALIKVYDNGDYALAFLKKYSEDKENVVFIGQKQVEFRSR